MFAIATSYVIGSFPSGLTPFVVETAITQFGFSEVQAGLMASAELATLAITATLLAIVIQQLDIGLLAIFGALVLGLGNILTIFTTDVFTFSLTRTMSSIGSGFIIVSAVTAVSSNTNYNRLLSRAILFTTLVLAILFFTLPRVAALMPKAGIFLMLAGLAFSAIPVLLFLQRGSRQAKTQLLFSANSLGIVAIIALSACFLCQLGDAVFWAFNLQIGDRAGYSAVDLGSIFALATLLGLAAPILANYSSTRFGRISSLVAINFIKGATALTLCYGIQPIFVVLQIIMMFAVLITALYMVALLAQLDPTGRLDALGVALTMTADAIGPALAGAVFASFGLVGVGTLSLAAAILTVGLLLTASKQLNLTE